MTTIHLVRHGQASLGAADYDRLSATGVRQSELLGRWWKQLGMRFDAVAIGSHRRHRDSALACLAALGVPFDPAEDAALDEFDGEAVLRAHRADLADGGAIERFFASEAEPARAFQSIFGAAVVRWVGGEHDGDYGEPWPAFRSRCLGAFEAIVRRAKDEGHANVAVFTSGGPITVACQAALGIPDARVLSLNWALLNAGVTRIRAASSGLRLAQFNAVPHLEVAGDDSLLTHR